MFNRQTADKIFVSSRCFFSLILFFDHQIAMGSLEQVPCVHVDRENVEIVWPILMQSIRDADFIALDLVSVC